MELGGWATSEMATLDAVGPPFSRLDTWPQPAAVRVCAPRRTRSFKSRDPSSAPVGFANERQKLTTFCYLWVSSSTRSTAFKRSSAIT